MKEGKLEWIGGDGSSVDVCSVPRIYGLSSHHGRSVQDNQPKALHLTAHQSPGDSLQALQTLVHHQGLRQGLGTSIANAVAGEPAREGTWVEQRGGVRPGGVRVREPSREGLSLVSRVPSTVSSA